MSEIPQTSDGLGFFTVYFYKNVMTDRSTKILQGSSQQQSVLTSVCFHSFESCSAFAQCQTTVTLPAAVQCSSKPARNFDVEKQKLSRLIASPQQSTTTSTTQHFDINLLLLAVLATHRLMCHSLPRDAVIRSEKITAHQYSDFDCFLSLDDSADLKFKKKKISSGIHAGGVQVQCRTSFPNIPLENLSNSLKHSKHSSKTETEPPPPDPL